MSRIYLQKCGKRHAHANKNQISYVFHHLSLFFMLYIIAAFCPIMTLGSYNRKKLVRLHDNYNIIELFSIKRIYLR